MGKLGAGAIESHNPKQIAEWTLKEMQNSAGLSCCLWDKQCEIKKKFQGQRIAAELQPSVFVGRNP